MPSRVNIASSATTTRTGSPPNAGIVDVESPAESADAVAHVDQVCRTASGPVVDELDLQLVVSRRM